MGRAPVRSDDGLPEPRGRILRAGGETTLARGLDVESQPRDGRGRRGPRPRRRHRYREVLRHDVARRLLVAFSVSAIGDYVGVAALLVLAFEQTDSALGPAAVFAVMAGPALLVGSVGSAWLDAPPRRPMLIALLLTGAAVTAGVALLPTVATALVAAGLLAAVRASVVSVNSAVIAENVPVRLRQPLFGLINVVGQTAQAVGLLTGASVALAVGVSRTLLVDALSFVLAAVVVATLRLRRPRRRGRRPSPGDGVRVILRTPVLRVLAPLAWASMVVGAVPETLAAAVGSPALVGPLMAAAPAGSAVGAWIVGRTPALGVVRAQILLSLALGVAFVLGAATLLFLPGAGGLLVANVIIGLTGAWLVAAQSTFAIVTPPRHMAQVTATMITAIIVLEGVGALLVGAITAVAGPGAAYAVVGVVVLVFALVALRTDRRDELRVAPPGDERRPADVGS